MGESAARFLQRGVFVDLEISASGEIKHVGATRGLEGFESRDPAQHKDVWRRLDRFAAGAAYVAGHNILDHDLPALKAVAPHLHLCSLPVIDTLRLSPLAFPEVPYHRLVKDYKLVSDSMNDPVADCRGAAQVLADAWERLGGVARRSPELASLHRSMLAGEGKGFDLFFEAIGVHPLDWRRDIDALKARFEPLACVGALSRILADMRATKRSTPEPAYAFAWLTAAGGGSVIPSWVRRRYPETSRLVSRLRDIPCDDPACTYCLRVHDPRTQLREFFGHDGFRPVAGRNLQEEVVRRGLRNEPVLAILPTGAGKSLCYQLPALVRHRRRGALTIVISPLQALMKDQVDKLRDGSAAAINGLLTPPERGQVLERVALGYIALLYVAPEQLRNRSFGRTIAQREIGCWVFDEAHCLSKWGHDFRPDYLYAARFIREFSASHGIPVAPVCCFTATAKREVRDEILNYFRNELKTELELFEAPVERENLRFEVEQLSEAEKLPRIDELLDERLSEGNAIMYCATRRRTEQYARFLAERGHAAEAFHAGLEAPAKRRIQDAFLAGEIRAICATNAFGMGIDKGDVRLVIHADIPGSLENYLQEAGRAGRDHLPASCVLLFDPADLETQFQLAATSRVSLYDIRQMLRGLRRRRRGNEPIVLTSGELLRSEDVHTSFDARERGADTKVKTGIAWLERAGFLKRNENFTRVFQGKPHVRSLEEARAKMASLNLSDTIRARWERLLSALFNAKADEGLSVDDLAEMAGVQDGGGPAVGEHILRTLDSMAEAGLIDRGLQLTAYVKVGVRDAAPGVLERVCALDRRLVELLQESAPDADAEDEGWIHVSLRELSHRLATDGTPSNPEHVRSLLLSLALDGAGPLAGGRGSLRLRQNGRQRFEAKLQRTWAAVAETAELRRVVAAKALETILDAAKAGGRGEILVRFSTEDIACRLREDLALATRVSDPLAAIDRGLLFLHEQKVIVLQHGLAVFRQAMSIHLDADQKGRRYTEKDYRRLAEHYGERVFQIHVMGRYAELGRSEPNRMRQFVAGYFDLAKPEFARRFVKAKAEALERSTSEASYTRIVTDMRNPTQESVVTAPAEGNRLILAGPGSGKTRVVVHRCAYLLRVLRVPARSILVVCFNRSAAWAVRRRLRDLVGDDARHVTIQTYHGLAARLVGYSFGAGTSLENGRATFDDLIRDAVKLLRGDVDVPGLEADEIRDGLLAGYQFILVDEYQDIDEPQYELVSAIAGRTEQDSDAKLAILAVGDDDQNIYGWRGANVEFIRRFRDDYGAEAVYLVENYRSTCRIIDAANRLIAHNRDRMKGGAPIRIDDRRRGEPPGRAVRILAVPDGDAQAAAIVGDLEACRGADPGWDPSECAVLARGHAQLAAIRAACERAGVPVRWVVPREKLPPLTRVREIHRFLVALNGGTTRASELERFLGQKGDWNGLLGRILAEWRDETSEGEVSASSVREFFYEALAEQRLDAAIGAGVTLSTIHAAKGTEYGHVWVADGGWRDHRDAHEAEEERRVLYVAMTRAKRSLTLLERSDDRSPHLRLLETTTERISWDLRTQEAAASEGRLAYEVLGMADMYLDFAAARPPTDPIHRRLASLRAGDRLSPEIRKGAVSLVDGSGDKVAQLSRRAGEEWADRLDRIRRIRVLAVIVRGEDDSDPAYRDSCLCESWEVPLVEIEYART
jgi:ATP-dependent DNA helicase RecQ